MSEKKTGYAFWNDCLNSPQYIAAPMVDMSELAFRILCRRWGSQLCFSPMFHSQQFVQDSLYRSDIFSTAPDDRPLIVQFCANDPTTFVKAASMVSKQCDAIDLNLGCPQSIARKGHYGAFLQDEWDLIQSMIKKAASELPIPVTCKMRILSGSSVRSVEYAKMLEHSGCSVLSVHGRTREQKGHATGLAAWDVIKDIKKSVSIPVIANGNILTIHDVHNCLMYTGVDAVMSAEGLLHNPALFSGRNPPVWEIVEEYLNLAEIFGTQMRYIRNHLYKILYLCLRHDPYLASELDKASSMKDFRELCVLLKQIPHSHSSEENHYYKNMVEPQEIVRSFKDILCFDSRTRPHEFLSDSYMHPIAERTNHLNSSFMGENENVHSDLKYSMRSKMNLPLEESINFNVECLEENNLSLLGSCVQKDDHAYVKVQFSNCAVGNVRTSERNNSSEKMVNSDKNQKIIKCFPIWLCHSRPRIIFDSEGRGWFQKFNDMIENEIQAEDESDKTGLSKKKLRKAKHHARVLLAMKDKRKTKKLRRKQRILELQEVEQKETMPLTSREKITKKQMKERVRQRMIDARGNSPKICIDLNFSANMTNKELHRLSSQLRRLYGSNRHTEKPLHLYYCNFSSTDPLYNICCLKNDGFSSYVVEMEERSPEEIFHSEEIIYLSPDSENVLENMDKNKVYVIGGIVDETVYKGMSLLHARNLHLKTARLPILEHLERSDRCNGGTVLTVNQVFDVLLKYYETEDWVQALTASVPQRKGFQCPL